LFPCFNNPENGLNRGCREILFPNGDCENRVVYTLDRLKQGMWSDFVSESSIYTFIYIFFLFKNYIKVYRAGDKIPLDRLKFGL